MRSAYLDSTGEGTPHTIESTAIFGVGNVNDDAEDDLENGYTTSNKNIIPVVMNYWISFVRDLDPNTHKLESAPYWESVEDHPDGARRIMIQTNQTTMELVPQDQVERCEFWRELAVVMEQ